MAASGNQRRRELSRCHALQCSRWQKGSACWERGENAGSGKNEAAEDRKTVNIQVEIGRK